jgi:hypothetical protein
MPGLNELETFLREARVVSQLMFERQGQHRSYLLICEGGPGIIAKPADEIGDGELLIKREVAAWIVARAAGWSYLVAATALRKINSFRDRSLVDTMVQVVWPNYEALADPSHFPDEDIWRAGAFDAVIGQTDRVKNNWIASPKPGQGAQVRLKLVDHGRAFANTPGPPNSEFYERKAGQELPAEVKEELERLRRGFPAQLKLLLDGPELAALNTRLERLIANGRLVLP